MVELPLDLPWEGIVLPRTLREVLENIEDPSRWADFETMAKVMVEVPSVRGMVYGNVAEARFAEWLVRNGVPDEDLGVARNLGM